MLPGRTPRGCGERVTPEPKVYVLHENPEWVEPLRDALERRQVPFEEWLLYEGALNLSVAPPPGVFYNRMSASSHTRGHRFGPEHASCVLPWLESHGRRVLNGSRALALEVNKVAQYSALSAAGVRTPHTVATLGKTALLEAAQGFPAPFITKHNRAGKGLGVMLFDSAQALQQTCDAGVLPDPVDGVYLLQQYIRAPEPFITRVELVGGEFLYAVRVDTSEGFELCPADACEVGDSFCPTSNAAEGARAKFEILEGFTSPLVEQYKALMRAHDVHIAGFEFIVDAEGNAYTYDINTNTNYNAAAEAGRGFTGMGAVADTLASELRKLGAQQKA